MDLFGGSRFIKNTLNEKLNEIKENRKVQSNATFVVIPIVFVTIIDHIPITCTHSQSRSRNIRHSVHSTGHTTHRAPWMHNQVHQMKKNTDGNSIKRGRKASKCLTESDDANMGKIIPFEWQKGKGIALEFEENEDVFMQMLSAPDGVCGGETLMYYESPLDGKEYIYLATDEDGDVIGVLQYDVAREKWSKFCE